MPKIMTLDEAMGIENAGDEKNSDTAFAPINSNDFNPSPKVMTLDEAMSDEKSAFEKQWSVDKMNYSKKPIPELRALTPEIKARSRMLTKEEEEAIKLERDIALIREYPTDVYSGVPASAEAFFQGLLPIRPKEMQRPGVEEAYPIAKSLGQVIGLIATSWLTGGIAPTVAESRTISALPTFARITAGRMAQSGAAFSLKSLADNMAELSAGDSKSFGKVLSDVSTEGAFGTGIGAVGSIAQPLLRIPAEAAYGYATAKIMGADNEEAGINAAIFAIFGTFNTKNLSREYKISAFNGAKRAMTERLMSNGLDAEKASAVADRYFQFAINRAGGWEKTKINDFDTFSKAMKKGWKIIVEPEVAPESAPPENAMKTVEKPVVPETAKPAETPEEALMTEARKYKSAEEFVSSQANPQQKYRVAFDIGGKVYEGKPGEIHAQLFDRLPEKVQEQYNNDVENQGFMSGFVDKKGEFQTRGDIEVRTGKVPNMEIVNEGIKTPSQLTDIWNKAHEITPKSEGNWEVGQERPFAFDPNSTKNEGRFRLYPPDELTDYFRRKSTTEGVSYVMGKDKDGNSIIQAIRFDKSIMPEEKAAKWWEENKGKYQFAEKGIESKAEKMLPEKDPIERLSKLLEEAKPLRSKLESKYTKERAKRIAEVERALETGGEQGYIKALSKLKGELAPGEKAVFEPLKEKLSQEELDALYDKTFKHPYLDNWEKINAASGLTKLLSGELPQPKQLVLMEEVYGSNLISKILAKRAMGLKIADVALDIANIPRAILASADMSGFLRQGVIYVASYPKIAAGAMGKTFQFAFSQKAFDQYFKDLPKDPLYNLMRKSNLAITDPSKAGLSRKEEAFMSRLMEKIPVLGSVLRFSERSYVGFLNKLRVDIFKTFSEEYLSRGKSPVKDEELFKATAEMVNTFTGRGDMGKANRIGPILNTVFFSPRLITARFNTLNPIWYANLPKEVRVKAIGDFGKFVASGLTIIALASLWKDEGVYVESDPRSSDFGKIKIGNTRFDIWAGFQQWARVFSQVITGQRKSASTGEIVSLTKEEYPFTTRKEVILRFVEGKFAPIPSLINEVVSGNKTFGGDDLTPEIAIKEKIIPMYIQDIADAYEDGGLGRSVGAGAAAFFGIGVQTYEQKKSKKYF